MSAANIFIFMNSSQLYKYLSLKSLLTQSCLLKQDKLQHKFRIFCGAFFKSYLIVEDVCVQQTIIKQSADSKENLSSPVCLGDDNSESVVQSLLMSALRILFLSQDTNTRRRHNNVRINETNQPVLQPFNFTQQFF